MSLQRIPSRDIVHGFVDSFLPILTLQMYTCQSALVPPPRTRGSGNRRAVLLRPSIPLTCTLARTHHPPNGVSHMSLSGTLEENRRIGRISNTVKSAVISGRILACFARWERANCNRHDDMCHAARRTRLGCHVNVSPCMRDLTGTFRSIRASTKRTHAHARARVVDHGQGRIRSCPRATKQPRPCSRPWRWRTHRLPSRAAPPSASQVPFTAGPCSAPRPQTSRTGPRLRAPAACRVRCVAGLDAKIAALAATNSGVPLLDFSTKCVYANECGRRIGWRWDIIKHRQI